MIRLNVPKEPYWIDVPFGARVQVRPLTTAIYEAARVKAARQVRALMDEKREAEAVGATLTGLPDLADEDQRTGFSQMLFGQALAQSAILDWEGIGEAEGDDAAPVTAENIAELMRLPAVAETFLLRYTAHQAAMAAEGNGSRPAPNGTSEAGLDTAKAAETPDSPVPTDGAA